MIKLLFLDWNSFGQEYMIKAFERDGFEVILHPWNHKQDMRNNDKLQMELQEKISLEDVIAVFSVNFYPIVAVACRNSGVKYISWIYDSPFLLLYSNALYLKTNYVFIFDKSLYLELKEQGVTTVYYLPMAAPAEYYDSIECSETDVEKYKAQISFVGAVYTEQSKKFMSLLKDANEYTRGYLEAVMNLQHELQGGFILEDVLTGRVLEELQRICPLERDDDEWETDAWIYANYFLARTITAKERSRYLDVLSEENDVKLYTLENTDYLEKVQNRGCVDYCSQMPLVFKNSKINLNITLRSIHTGIPLRVMDIMGCGGFLLTNYQEDLLDYFEPDHDFVFFEDEEDLVQKVKYYLDHDEERAWIAKNGFDKIKKSHTYQHRIKEILQITFDNNELFIYQIYDQIQNIRMSDGEYIWHQHRIYQNDRSDNELLEMTDEWMNQMEKEKELFFQLKLALKEHVEILLKQGSESAWELILLWYNRMIGLELSCLFKEFSYLRIFVEIYIIEKREKLTRNSTISILQFHSLQQLMEVYINCEFLFLRIERDMLLEDMESLIEKVKSYKLTEKALDHILEKSAVWNKTKVRPFFSRKIQVKNE